MTNTNMFEVFQSTIVICNARKDVLAAAIRDAVEYAQLPNLRPLAYAPADGAKEREERAEHLAALCECV